MSDLAERMRSIFSGSSLKNSGYRGYPATALKNLEKKDDEPGTTVVTASEPVVVTTPATIMATTLVTEKSCLSQSGSHGSHGSHQKPRGEPRNGETGVEGLGPEGDEPVGKRTEAAVVACGKTVATTSTRVSLEDGHEIPVVFAGAYSRLLQGCPVGVDHDRWLRVRADARTFLTTWGEQAAALGWLPEDLFDLHPTAPLARYDHMGLAWLLQGQCVFALDEDTATIRTPSGARLIFRPHRSAGAPR
jgi:hypothetical protein